MMGEKNKNEKVYVTDHRLRVTDYQSWITHHTLPKKMKTHKDLDVWKEAMTLVKKIYRLTADFPKEEKCCSV